MASFLKRGNSWRVQVFRNGIRQSATFPTKAQAQAWAAQVESEIAAGKRGEIPNKTFGDLLRRYSEEVSPGKRGCRWEQIRIKKLLADKLAGIKLADLNESHISDWRDRRIKEVSKASVRREWTLLSHACTIGRKEWKWLRSHPMTDVRRPEPAKPRNVTFTDDEIKRILYALGSDYQTTTARVGAAFLFALETAMRAGEICRLARSDITGRVAHLQITKNGHPRDVPLSAEAMRIIEALPVREDGRAFGLSESSLDAIFRKAKAMALITRDITFHDSRGTALTRLAKILTPFELAKVSGHRDLRILLQTYFRESAENIAEKINSSPSS